MPLSATSTDMLSYCDGVNVFGERCTGSLLKQEQRPDRVPGEPNPWFDLGVFMAFKQAYFQRS